MRFTNKGMFGVHSQNCSLRSGSLSVRCYNICGLYEWQLLARKLHMICRPIAQRRWVPNVGLSAIPASTCADIPSSAVVFDLPGVLAWTTETVLLNF
ncbi:hypothetical protein AVEN_34476-1 [Araneus ventricosus]|uniref:Uncharacterized protein n=1 Tax=Araneus ventricosus TaxID=182803 RepID=A0A4Y2UM98_ARAVE|nr:hypothetical protein AVEN_34475-1 [Araneus ventricosus]GBO13353.1 hypothetical protein AVEN_34476-1 [Araneus ventricosus]